MSDDGTGFNLKTPSYMLKEKDSEAIRKTLDKG
eukprot:CAMPEP_0176349950 /NCGR_PEP_ID=MMETSP0126-20121128/9083_1 /TAXON_ID=141414 ORGANISM="Strombidinopsis acuminatum, Strain SPMC142" /NCGR_SAMPLE_ID=MMETSP0126 /ASSEMBLY_ACC=CAM_ASM_000229 /LENGTH=32 /DNA_ID= /DNA_START= /DNA_END= /DNA_ORIENTATION=